MLLWPEFVIPCLSPTVKTTAVQAKGPGALSSAVRLTCGAREADALIAHFPEVSIKWGLKCNLSPVNTSSGGLRGCPWLGSWFLGPCFGWGVELFR